MKFTREFTRPEVFAYVMTAAISTWGLLKTPYSDAQTVTWCCMMSAAVVAVLIVKPVGQWRASPLVLLALALVPLGVRLSTSMWRLPDRAAHDVPATAKQSYAGMR